MTRTVADAGLLLDAIKGPDSRDWLSLPDDGVAYRERVAEGSLKGKRVALSPTLGYAEPAPEVRQAVERAAASIQRLGDSLKVYSPADNAVPRRFRSADRLRLQGVECLRTLCLGS